MSLHSSAVSCAAALLTKIDHCGCEIEEEHRRLSKLEWNSWGTNDSVIARRAALIAFFRKLEILRGLFRLWREESNLHSLAVCVSPHEENGVGRVQRVVPTTELLTITSPK